MFSNIKQSQNDVQRIVDNYTRSIELGKPVVLKSAIEKITAGVSTLIFLGPKSQDKKIWGEDVNIALIQYTKDMSASVQSGLLGYLIMGKNFFLKQYRKCDQEVNRKNREFRAFTKQIIDEEVRNQTWDGYTSVIKTLYQSNSLDFKNEQDIEYVCSEIYNFLIAGKDTTMNMTQMALYYLATQPELLRNVEREVVGKATTHESLQEMKYLHGFINEVLRVYGPAQSLIARISDQDVMIDDLLVKKGTYINIGTIINHYSPKYYPEPFVIKPER